MTAPTYDLEWTMRNTTKIIEAALGTEHLGISDDNTAAETLVTLQTSKGLKLVIDDTCSQIEQIETPGVSALRSELDNVVPSSIEMETKPAAQFSRMTKQVVGKEISHLCS